MTPHPTRAPVEASAKWLQRRSPNDSGVRAKLATYKWCECKVLLVNLGAEAFTITRGMRIAQFVVAPVTRGRWREAALDETARGSGGFGSTGTA